MRRPPSPDGCRNIATSESSSSSTCATGAGSCRWSSIARRAPAIRCWPSPRSFAPNTSFGWKARSGSVRSSTKNPKMPTGEVELVATSIELLSRAETPPFPIDDEVEPHEDLRLKYRYLDLRRPAMARNLIAARPRRHGHARATWTSRASWKSRRRCSQVHARGGARIPRARAASTRGRSTRCRSRRSSSSRS